MQVTLTDTFRAYTLYFQVTIKYILEIGYNHICPNPFQPTICSFSAMQMFNHLQVMHGLSRLERHVFLFGMCILFGSVTKMASLRPSVNKVNNSCISKNINYLLP